MPGAMTYFGYRSDDSNVYQLRRNVHHLQVVGTPLCGYGKYPQAPGDMRPRYVVARHRDGKHTREVVVDDVTRPVWMGHHETLGLPDWAPFPSQMVAFRIMFRVAERVHGSRRTRKSRTLPPPRGSRVPSPINALSNAVGCGACLCMACMYANLRHARAAAS
jgi:hypothetical protein